MAAKRSSQYGIEMEMPFDLVAEVTCFFGLFMARSNANFMMRSTPRRVNILSWTTTSCSVPSNMSEEISAAARIVGWHLNEARRLLADLDTPPSLAAAIRLDSWLRSEAQASGTDRVPTKRIYQYGPNCVRDSRDLRAALAILAERGRAWLEESDRHPARTLIGSKSSESSRGCRVGNSVFHVPGARRMTGARGVIVLAF
jgi:hypothetical protein